MRSLSTPAYRALTSRKNIVPSTVPATVIASNRPAAVVRSAIETLEGRKLFASITVTSSAAGVAEDGVVTLNEAILSSNANAAVNADVVATGTYGTNDQIDFNIAQAGQVTITDAALPPITDAVTINGYSQTGSTANTLMTGGTDANLNIVLSGSPLTVQADGTTIRGLALTGNATGPALLVNANNVTLGGNFIGTADGLNAAGNSVGVSIGDNFSGTVIGGTTPADVNLISGNAVGVGILGDLSIIENNIIGANETGTAALLGTPPDLATEAGVYVLGGTGNRIGGATADEGNIIAFNQGDGVLVDAAALGTVIGANNIYSNAALGIDILPTDGPTANDANDPDTVQNTPVLVGARQTTGGQLDVEFTLNSRNAGTYLVEFFSNATVDESGFGEGQVFLGSTTVTTSGTGNFSGTFTLPVSVAEGQFITATATDTNAITTRGTSEFSNGVTVLAAPVTNVPSLAINDVTKNEGDTGTTDFVFTLTRSGDTTGTITVDYNTADGTATVADNDYVDTAGTVTFLPGETTKTITVQVNGDTKTEASETFDVMLTNPVGATLGTDTAGTGTITNDDGTGGGGGGTPPPNPTGPGISVSDGESKEGNDGECYVTFTVTRTGDTSASATVDFATQSDTAGEGKDFVSRSGTLTFAAGETTKTIDVRILPDNTTEPDEKFLLALSNPDDAVIVDGTGVGTIRNDDFGSSVITINNVNKVEGDSGNTPFTFTVTRSGDISSKTQVYYTTRNSTAKAGSDYDPQDGTLVFQPGEATKTITVNVNGDNVVEADEAFRILLGGATYGTITDGKAVGFIIDDDKTAASSFLRISDVKKAEGNSGTTNFTFTVTRSGSADASATVDYATQNSSAKGGSDYIPTSGKLTFAKGERTKTITVKVKGDKLVEPNETFKVNLSNASGAVLVETTGYGTIVNDDDPGRTPRLTIKNASVTEGDNGLKKIVFGVMLDGPSLSTVTVNYRTADGTAKGDCDCDFDGTSGKLMFAPGEVYKSITVFVKGDTKDEVDEQFQVRLSSPKNATIADGTATGTIVDDD